MVGFTSVGQVDGKLVHSLDIAFIDHFNCFWQYHSFFNELAYIQAFFVLDYIP